MNGAELLSQTLLLNGVDVCFANPGTSEMHFVAALDRTPQLRCILGLAETVVTGAADGYGRMAEKPAATLLHLGPGLANGLSNLHNARRAATPLLNIVGDHASYHLAADAPLTSDIDSLAWPVSAWVGRVENPNDVADRTVEALTATRDGAAGQVATMVLPADSAWGLADRNDAPLVCSPAVAKPPSVDRVGDACDLLRGRDRVAILLGGDAVRAPHMEVASRIANATGASLFSEHVSRRIECGAGRVAPIRVPYSVDDAVAAFSRFSAVILIGADEPVAFFAYPGKPSTFLPDGCDVIKVATPSEDALIALTMIADEIGLGDSCASLMPLELPDVPYGAITAETLGAAVARALPEGAIVCNEAITGGGPFIHYAQRARPHDLLGLTGGAIGCGIPLSIGAAIACPNRKVVNLQADGSGFYALQGLWTQARERLDIVTVILANRRYGILRHELASVGAGKPGLNASRMLDIDDPAPDWVKLALGMGVDAVRVDSAEELADVFSNSMSRPGPFLIEALMP